MKSISIIVGAAVLVGAAAFLVLPGATTGRNAAEAQPSQRPQTQVPTSMNMVHLTFAPVVKRVVPAVVNVYSRSIQQVQVNPLFSDPFFSQFFGATPEMRKRVEQSLGSGVIVRSDGIIVTNDHVVKGGTDIVVVLSDKREFKAKVLMADPRTDLAVLKIDTKGEKLPTVPFGDSDKLEVGDLVLAVGDPFGVGQTVTMGIVSALARTQGSANNYKFFIQTDAAINPGNSGGALVTTDGRLAGLNTAIYSRSGGNIGIGFAIPANLVRRVVEGVERGLKEGRPADVQLAWVGATGQAVTNDIANSLGLAKPGGVLIKDVYPGGPLARAGIGSGDIVESIDGSSVDDMQALRYRTATHRPGDKVTMRVLSNGKARDVAVTLTLPPENPPRDLRTVGGRNPLTGAKVENVSPATAIELQLDPLSKGVAVVETGGIASNYGFQPGDIIKSINGRDVGSVNELLRLLGGANRWQLVIQRGGQQLTLSVAR